ncbi:hypothetical protein E4U21_006653 [Claviceps maximensis]|nr:hypothetical protein E4U21_006653 [Claviceps maximensis]
MRFSFTTLALAVPQLALALVGNEWDFSGNPAGGLKDITFPFRMNGAAHKSGYYFAQQFNFQGINEVAYCGIQNRPDKGGQSIVHAVFSTFQGGSTTTDANCHSGADGGPGISCAVDFAGDYNAVYNIVVQQVTGTTWKGTAVNTSTGKSFHIGSFTLPSTAGGIKSSQLGFVEYYPWNQGGPYPCSSLPKTAVTMYKPSSKTPGAGTGRIKKPYEYGNCVGRAGFATNQVTNGFAIRCGF